MKLMKQIHDLATGKIITVEETDEDVIDREARIAYEQAAEDKRAEKAAKAKDKPLKRLTDEEIEAVKTVADMKALLKKMNAED
jgi:hypothetical protein